MKRSSTVRARASSFYSDRTPSQNTEHLQFLTPQEKNNKDPQFQPPEKTPEFIIKGEIIDKQAFLPNNIRTFAQSEKAINKDELSVQRQSEAAMTFNQEKNIKPLQELSYGTFRNQAADKQKMEKSLQDRYLLVTLLVSVTITFTLFGNIVTFYPPYRTQHHPTINDTMVGVVLSMFEVGYLITSPIISLSMAKIGRKNYILIGDTAQVLSSIGFGLLVYVKDDMKFFIISIILKIMQGFGDAAVTTAFFSIISIEFPTEQELYFGYFECAVGVGFMLGPAMGQVLFNNFDFEWTFYITAMIVTIPVILQLFWVPNRLNSSALKEGSCRTSQQSGNNPNNKKITFKHFLTNRRAMMASVASIFAMIFMLFYDVIYSNHLLSIGVPKEHIGFYFALSCFVYSVFSPFVGYLCKFIAKPYLTQFSFLICSFSLILFGPSLALGLPESLTLMIIGNILLGFSTSFIFVPLPAEILDAVKEKEGITEINEQLSDLAAGVFNSSYGLGCLLAPILGGFFNDQYGFRNTCDIFAFSSLLFAILYFIFNLIPFIISRRQNVNNLPNIKEL